MFYMNASGGLQLSQQWAFLFFSRDGLAVLLSFRPVKSNQHL